MDLDQISERERRINPEKGYTLILNLSERYGTSMKSIASANYKYKITGCKRAPIMIIAIPQQDNPDNKGREFTKQIILRKYYYIPYNLLTYGSKMRRKKFQT